MVSKCFVISAPSGAGKTSLVNRLIVDKPGVFYDSVSDTTRKKRSGEVNGKDYNFISIPEFQSRFINDKYLEWANVHENFYGTLKAPLFDAMDGGKFPLLVIDVQGYFQAREKIPYDKLCPIFILPPDEKELARRICGRGAIDEKDLEIRLSNSKKELAVASEFKYCLRNDNFDVAYSVLKSIVEVEIGLGNNL
jgi:guanylate kinase